MVSPHDGGPVPHVQGGDVRVVAHGGGGDRMDDRAGGVDGAAGAHEGINDLDVIDAGDVGGAQAANVEVDVVVLPGDEDAVVPVGVGGTGGDDPTPSSGLHHLDIRKPDGEILNCSRVSDASDCDRLRRLGASCPALFRPPRCRVPRAVG